MARAATFPAFFASLLPALVGAAAFPVDLTGPLAPAVEKHLAVLFQFLYFYVFIFFVSVFKCIL